MRLAVPIAVLVAFAAGCGGGSNESTEPLRDGVYEFELTEEYLLENGIPSSLAESDSGVQQTTLDAGSFVNRWRTEQGTTGTCSGTYEEDGNRVTFRWTSGCFGDWAMSYTVEGNQVAWSDIEALPPYDSEQDQRVAEVFSSVPWTRVGDVPES
jgi:hypothetical protein